MSNTPAGQPQPPEKKPGGRGKLLIIAAVAIVVLAGGGLTAFWALWPAGDSHAEPAAKHAGTGVVSFEPFVVNLADAGGQRFLRISIRLVVDEQEDAERIQKNEVLFTRVRSAILEL